MASSSCANFAGIFILLLWCLKTNKCHVMTDVNCLENAKTDTLINFLNIAGTALHSAEQIANGICSVTLSSIQPMDCAEIQQLNTSTKSGIYKIWPRSRLIRCPITVYCDMDDDGGAWTLIQRRGDFDSPKDYFYRNWTAYKNGFGDVSKDFWIGNDNIFSLTTQRASVVKFVLRDWENKETYAQYEDFWIDDENQKYKMHVAGYRGNAGDSFSFTNGMFFTTRDEHNDLYSENCAVMYKGAWWYAKCHSSNLNGQYLKGTHESYADGVNWGAFRGAHYSLKDTVIKIRPRDFVKFELDATPQ